MNAAPETSRTSISLTLAIAALAVLVYAFGMMPAGIRLDGLRRELNDRQSELDGISRDLRDSDSVESRLAQAEQDLKPFQDALITPLLGSAAMRMKSLFDPLATAAGLANATYLEQAIRPLPQPPSKPAQPHVRQPVRMTCTGSFAAAVSFLLRVRRDFPLTTIGGFTISALQDCERQSLEFVFEFPAAGARPATKKAPNKGRKAPSK